MVDYILETQYDTIMIHTLSLNAVNMQYTISGFVVQFNIFLTCVHVLSTCPHLIIEFSHLANYVNFVCDDVYACLLSGVDKGAYVRASNFLC